MVLRDGADLSSILGWSCSVTEGSVVADGEVTSTSSLAVTDKSSSCSYAVRTCLMQTEFLPKLESLWKRRREDYVDLKTSQTCFMRSFLNVLLDVGEIDGFEWTWRMILSLFFSRAKSPVKTTQRTRQNDTNSKTTRKEKSSLENSNKKTPNEIKR